MVVKGKMIGSSFWFLFIGKSVSFCLERLRETRKYTRSVIYHIVSTLNITKHANLFMENVTFPTKVS
jgi:hypothetical protein